MIILRQEYTKISRNIATVKLWRNILDENKARKIMILKIRCTLVRNPYDFVGRKMSLEVKKLFLSHVLGEKKKWYKSIFDIFYIPQVLKQNSFVKRLITNGPTFNARSLGNY